MSILLNSTNEEYKMSEIIGFIGLGHMGRAMASNLLKAGYRFRVYNRDARKAEPLVAEGPQLVKHPGGAHETTGTLITRSATQPARSGGTLSAAVVLEHLWPPPIHTSLRPISLPPPA